MQESGPAKRPRRGCLDAWVGGPKLRRSEGAMPPSRSPEGARRVAPSGPHMLRGYLTSAFIVPQKARSRRFVPFCSADQLQCILLLYLDV